MIVGRLARPEEGVAGCRLTHTETGDDATAWP